MYLFLLPLFLVCATVTLSSLPSCSGVCHVTGSCPSHDREIGRRACTTTWEQAQLAMDISMYIYLSIYLKYVSKHNICT